MKMGKLILVGTLVLVGGVSADAKTVPPVAPPVAVAPEPAQMKLVTRPSAIPPAPVPAKAGWVVNPKPNSCQLVWAGADIPVTLSLSQNPGSGEWLIYLANRDWQQSPAMDEKPRDVILLPDGRKATGRDYSGIGANGPFIALGEISETFLDGLQNARGIAVESNGTRLIEVPFEGSPPPLDQLNQCSVALLTRWGIDPVAHSRLKRRAIPSRPANEYFDASDYPDVARRNDLQGTVTARLDIGIDGRVSNCTSVGDLVHQSLIDITCTRLVEKAIFSPAIGQDGQPIASQYVSVFFWRLAD